MVCINNQAQRDPVQSMSGNKTIPSTGITVFCDLDGPLIDVSRRYYKTYKLAIAETQYHYQTLGQTLQLDPISEGRFWRMKRERIPDIDIAARTGFQDEQIEFFLNTVKGLVNQPLLLQEDQLQDWAIESLESLKAAGASLSLVTLRAHDQAIQILKRFGIYHHFDYVRGARDELAAYENYADYKTSILVNLLNTMNLETRDAVWMIGDTEADVKSAQATGIGQIALSCGMRSIEYLQRLEPTCVFDDLSQATQYLMETYQVA